MAIEEIIKESTVGKKTKSKSKKKHKLDIRSMIGTCIGRLEKDDLDYIENIIWTENKSTCLELLVQRYGEIKGQEYMASLKPLFNKIDK